MKTRPAAIASIVLGILALGGDIEFPTLGIGFAVVGCVLSGVNLKNPDQSIRRLARVGFGICVFALVAVALLIVFGSS